MTIVSFPPLAIDPNLELWAGLLEFGIYALFLGGPIAIGFVFGRYNESCHLESIRQREKELLYLPCVTSKLEHVTTPEQRSRIQSSYLVAGSVVLSDDFFKKTVADLRGVFGGNIASYESIVDRARREAILRMKEQARHMDMIVNTRIETSCINMSSKAKDDDVPTTIEVLAFGTAIAIDKAGYGASSVHAHAHTPAKADANVALSQPQPPEAPASTRQHVETSNLASPPHHLQEPPMPAPLPEIPQVAPVDFSNITLPKHNSLFNQ